MGNAFLVSSGFFPFKEDTLFFKCVAQLAFREDLDFNQLPRHLFVYVDFYETFENAHYSKQNFKK